MNEDKETIDINISKIASERFNKVCVVVDDFHRGNITIKQASLDVYNIYQS